MRLNDLQHGARRGEVTPTLFLPAFLEAIDELAPAALDAFS